MVNIIKQEIEMEIASSITLDNMKKKGISKQLLPNNQYTIKYSISNL